MINTHVPACPPWCNQPAGHDYDSVDVTDDSELCRIHEHDFGRGDVSADIVATGRSGDGGRTEILDVEGITVWLNGNGSAPITAEQARHLAAMLMDAADLLDKIN